MKPLQEMRPIVSLKRATTNTKTLITGDGGAFVRKLESDVDTVLKDLEHLNQALWKVTHEYKGRVFKALETVLPDAKPGNSKAGGELKRGWSKLAKSTENLRKDLRAGARTITPTTRTKTVSRN